MESGIEWKLAEMLSIDCDQWHKVYVEISHVGLAPVLELMAGTGLPPH